MSSYWHQPDLPPFRIHHWDGEDMIIRLEHYLTIPTSRGAITIPTGFLSDGLSIPAIVRPLVGPSTGRPFMAGLLHDFLYSKASTSSFNMTREDADKLFLEVMFNLGIGYRRNLIYQAVRMFGWRHHKKR